MRPKSGCQKAKSNDHQNVAGQFLVNRLAKPSKFTYRYEDETTHEP